jgi:tetratricopeptide (TPR) repeat protein
MCPKCKQGYLYEPEAFEGIISTLKEQAADAVIALQNGERSFTTDQANGEPLDCVAFLQNVLEWIYASNQADFVRGIIEQLAGPNCRYAHTMLTGTLETMRGKTDKAIDAYSSASAVEPKSAAPFQQRAMLLVQRRRHDEAIDAMQGAVAADNLDPQVKVGILAQMAEQQMIVKRFADAVDSYEQLLRLRPDLGQDPTLSKAFRKAKKKAGVQ